MTARFTNELWLEVFKHCRRPLPRPHSGENIERSEIRQPELINLLRVSKLWYELAAPILYLTIVADDIRLLFHGVKHIPIDGITPKIQLLGQTRRLFLEYGEPETDYAITNEDMDNYFHACFSMEGEDFAKYRMSLSRIEEIKGYAEAWKTIAGGENYVLLSFMSSLQTVAVAAFLDYESKGEGGWQRWYTCMGKSVEVCDAYEERWEVDKWFWAFLYANPSIKHVCHTPYGPLSLGFFKDTYRYPQYSGATSTHLYSASDYLYDNDIIAVPPGSNLTWYDHTEPAEDLKHFTSSLKSAIADASERRGEMQSDRPAFASHDSKWDFHTRVYLNSTNSEVAELGGEVDHLTEAQKELKDVLKSANGPHELSGGKKVVDRWEVGELRKAPVCEACGWGPDV